MISRPRTPPPQHWWFLQDMHGHINPNCTDEYYKVMQCYCMTVCALWMMLFDAATQLDYKYTALYSLNIRCHSTNKEERKKAEGNKYKYTCAVE